MSLIIVKIMRKRNFGSYLIHPRNIELLLSLSTASSFTVLCRHVIQCDHK